MAFEIVPVWKQVTPELRTELLDFWKINRAIGDPAQADQRVDQAVCIGRGEDGALCAVATVKIRVFPRLRQPMYYYRHFFAENFRGQHQTVPFYNRVRDVLQAYNQSLPQPESLGVLIELENPILAAAYSKAYVEQGDSTFIGYSPRGYQMRVSYFDDATLMPPMAPD